LHGWIIQPFKPYEGYTLQLKSKQVACVSTLTAIGAVTRIALSEFAISSPQPLYGILVKLGLSETLAFIDGFVYGPATGFLTGFLIILISDMFVLPGPWTPYIAAIIGLVGMLAGIARRLASDMTVAKLAACAVVCTLVSELLQNTWIVVFFNISIVVTFITGFPSLVTALVNNVVLFPTVGLRIIRHLQRNDLQR
jgi:uncharacterized membrane protein